MRKLTAVLGIVACSCASTREEMTEARHQPCEDVLTRYLRISADADYASYPKGVRIAYETTVASCYLDRRRPEKAVALARSWGDEQRAETLRVEARADAQLDKKADCRAALERYVKEPDADPYFFTEEPEFRNYAAEDWYIGTAIDAWSRTKMPAMERYAARLLHLGGANLLSLEVAAADPHRRTGEWALWLGAVRESRLDRASGQTYLSAVGLDVKQVAHVDRKVASVKYEGTWSGGIKGTPTYDETESYQEVFVPNGRSFIVKYPKVSEKLVGMKTILALGHYAGREGEEGIPVLSALLVMERKAEEHAEHDP